jgi:signal transduction histidine kinase
MKSIKAELLQVYLIIIGTFAVVGVGLLFIHIYIVNNYKNLVATTAQESQLITVTSNLTSAYNTLYLNSNTNTTSAEQQLNAAKTSIKQITDYLNKSIVDNQSKAYYVGLKNTINTLVDAINTSLNHLSHGNITNYTTDYNNVTQLFGYVQNSDTSLIYSQLNYINSINPSLNRDYEISQIVGGGVVVLAAVFSLIFTFKFAIRLTLPLSQLTTMARKISGGNNEVAIEPELLARKDEIGSLSNSIKIMLDKLKANLQELLQQNIIVERKVDQRTAELNDEKVRLEASIESLNIGFIMTDANNETITINHTAKDTLSHEVSPQGSTKIDVKTQDWTTDFIQSRMIRTFDLKANISKTISTSIPTQIEELNYNGRILRLFMAPVVEIVQGQITSKLGSVILLEDVTEAKILERSKDEFFSIASHELRTPLTSIRGNSSMILNFYKDMVEGNTDLKEMIQDIHLSSIRLIDIVNDFLDVSRLEQGKMKFTFTPVSLDKIIENIAYEMKTVLNEKKQYLNVDELTLGKLPPVWGDENRLKQVIYNLLGNAAKFTEKGGISISATIDQTKNMVEVLVTDTGRGISPDAQQLLFHKFQQASTSLLTRDTTRGTGLGLYISKMIIENMGGIIQLVKSEVDHGTTFGFTIPIATPERQAATTTVQINTQTNSATGMTGTVS